MQYTVLGKTGLNISRMGCGGIPIQKIDPEGVMLSPSRVISTF